jgi:NAD(P) transhydrogenase subunit beta
MAAKKVKMTKMPEMVSLFNGLGGACSMLIAAVEFVNLPEGTPMMSGQVLTIIFALFVGSIAFTGSIVAWGKLDGFLRDNLVLPAPQVINLVMLLAVVGLSGYIMMQPEMSVMLVMILLVLSMVYGVTFVTPIGGGDMPVVISLLNSFHRNCSSRSWTNLWQPGNDSRWYHCWRCRHHPNRTDVQCHESDLCSM